MKSSWIAVMALCSFLVCASVTARELEMTVEEFIDIPDRWQDDRLGIYESEITEEDEADFLERVIEYRIKNGEDPHLREIRWAEADRTYEIYANHDNLIPFKQDEAVKNLTGQYVSIAFADDHTMWTIEEIEINDAEYELLGSRHYKWHKFYLSCNGRVVYDLFTSDYFQETGIVTAFLSNGVPYLQYKWDMGIQFWIDGDLENARYGFSHIIMPVFYNGKLFYLFEADGKWGWQYDGEFHYDVWDKVYFNYAGQGGIIHQIWEPNQKKGFSAQRDGKWYTCRPVLK